MKLGALPDKDFITVRGLAMPLIDKVSINRQMFNRGFAKPLLTAGTTRKYYVDKNSSNKIQK